MQYKITNQNTGKEQLITIPDKFQEAEVVNLVLGWNHSPNDPEDLFEEPEDNRNENQTLMKKLMESIPKYGQLQPATVNPEGKIWEGNHRKKVTKETGEKYIFIIDDGYHKGNKLSQAEYTDEINEVREDYKIEDWLARYEKRYHRGQTKYESYVRFRDFMSKGVNKSIYNNLIYFAPDDSGRGKLKEQFVAGTFNPKQTDWATADGIRRLIQEVGSVWGNRKAVGLSYFMIAYIGLLQNPDINFSHQRFIDKLTKHSMSMKECARSEDYVKVINEIYNKGVTRKEKEWLY